MRSRMRRTNRIRDILIFWSLVTVSAGLLACGGFMAGKHWVGGLIAREKADGGTTPKIVVQTPDQDSGPGVATDVEMTEPPPKPVVKLQQRDPSEAERSEIEQRYPQDGASLNRAGSDSPGDASTGSDEKPIGDGVADRIRGYTVVAGSFTDPTNAERELSDLLGRGLSPFIVKVVRDGQAFHRVTLGPYPDRAAAARVRDELQTAGKVATISSR
jgi:cell division protein FtsN